VRNNATGTATAAAATLADTWAWCVTWSTTTWTPAPTAATAANTTKCPYPQANVARELPAKSSPSPAWRTWVAGWAKYTHHSANTMTSAPTATAATSARSPASSASWNATVAARIASPSTMMVKSPYRSTMWWGCHVVDTPRSATTGTASSAAAITRNPARSAPSGTSRSSSHPTWHATMPTA
jgi:hypothetical protein